MAKSPKTFEQTEKEEAFEMIEMATADIELLARAFNVVAAVCEGKDEAPEANEEPLKPFELLLN